MSQPADLPALHLLNSVFAGVTGQDLYLAEQMKAGIEQAIAANGGEPPTPEELARAVEQLRAKLGRDADRHGFFHWDAAHSPEAPDSLWAREFVLTGLRKLAPYTEATLLVTNLRAALCPPGQRWTERRQHAYRDTINFLAELAAARKRRSASVNLIVI